MTANAAPAERTAALAAVPSGTMGSGRARLVERLDPPADFNFRHFRMRHMAAELLRGGLPPGTEAPDFTLPTTDGGTITLRSLRGQPVLVHFVGYTCPVTRGSSGMMRELHARYGHQVRFLDVVVRQAHPGERHGPYRTWEAKRDDGVAFATEESVAWPVAIDDLAGTVQRAYGGTAASVCLIERWGSVAFSAVWGASPALRQAIDELLARGGLGWPAGRGHDRRPHLGAAIVAGQGGPLRGGRRALLDLELGFPGAAALMVGGRVLRPVLAPLVLRTTPLPPFARVGLVGGLIAAGVAALGLRGQGRGHPARRPPGVRSRD